MLREGPLSAGIHGLIEYVAGVLFIAAPFLLGFTDNTAALGVSIVVGVIVLAMAASMHGPVSLIDSVSVSVHAAFDYALAAFLIATPFIFMFATTDGDGVETAFFIILGVLHLLVTIATRFKAPAVPSE